MNAGDHLIRFLRHPFHEHSNSLHESVEQTFQSQVEILALLRHGLVDLAVARRRCERQPAQLLLERDVMLAEEDQLTSDVHRLEAKATRFRTLSDSFGPTCSADDARLRIAETASRIAEEMGQVQLGIGQAVANTARLERARAHSRRPIR